MYVNNINSAWKKSFVFFSFHLCSIKYLLLIITAKSLVNIIIEDKLCLDEKLSSMVLALSTFKDVFLIQFKSCLLVYNWY